LFYYTLNEIKNGIHVFASSLTASPGVLLGIFGGGVPPASPNPDPISDQKLPFSTPFSDLASKIHTRFQT